MERPKAGRRPIHDGASVRGCQRTVGARGRRAGSSAPGWHPPVPGGRAGPAPAGSSLTQGKGGTAPEVCRVHLHHFAGLGILEHQASQRRQLQFVGIGDLHRNEIMPAADLTQGRCRHPAQRFVVDRPPAQMRGDGAAARMGLPEEIREHDDDGAMGEDPPRKLQCPVDGGAAISRFMVQDVANHPKHMPAALAWRDELLDHFGEQQQPHPVLVADGRERQDACHFRGQLPFRLLPEPNRPEPLRSTMRSTVCSRSSRNFFTNGWFIRAVTFQSIARTSSPGWYSRTSSKSIPWPLNAEWYWPASVSSTRRRVRSSIWRIFLSSSLGIIGTVGRGSGPAGNRTVAGGFPPPGGPHGTGSSSKMRWTTSSADFSSASAS